MYFLREIISIDFSRNKFRYIMEGIFNFCLNLKKIFMSDNLI